MVVQFLSLRNASCSNYANDEVSMLLNTGLSAATIFNYLLIFPSFSEASMQRNIDTSNCVFE
jgi:hypothetical protein